MSSSRVELADEYLALDTNQFVFALRRDPRFPGCASLLFDQIDRLNIHVPLQVMKELHRNLTRRELRQVFSALEAAQECRIDYAPGEAARVLQWEQRGAKKGDAVIVAQLEVAQVKILVTENRHFLSEVNGLPFDVMASEQVVQLLEEARQQF